MASWDWLWSSAGLAAHGFCLSWQPELVALHAVSDAIVALSYFSIPLALATFAIARRDLRYGWVLYLFVGFILACGTTHLMATLTLWVPLYGIEGLVKLVTALLSMATAIVLWPLLPRLLALPSPAQLERLNRDLTSTVAEQERAALLLRDREARGRAANLELGRRVTEQTTELLAMNAQLSQALAEREAALRALQRSEQEFRISFERSSVGKALADPHSARLVRVNTAFAEMLGYTPAEMVGRDGWEFTWPEDRTGDMAEFERVMAGDLLTYRREKRYLRRDGQPVWGLVSGTLVTSADEEQPPLLILVIENVDARHKATLAANQARRELEAALQQRTAALRQRDMLLREVYHRVKNNLQIVDSLLAMQAAELHDRNAADGLLALRHRVHALGLVHAQLMNSRDLRTFDVAPFLRELIANLGEAGGDTPRIALSVSAIPLDVGLDFAIPLGLLVTELVTNSMKHAFPDGVGTIAVSLEQEDARTVVLTVADDGRGPPPAPQGAPPGLGTVIIEGLASQLEGTVERDNQSGMRTTIRLPSPVPGAVAA